MSKAGTWITNIAKFKVQTAASFNTCACPGNMSSTLTAMESTAQHSARAQRATASLKGLLKGPMGVSQN